MESNQAQLIKIMELNQARLIVGDSREMSSMKANHINLHNRVLSIEEKHTKEMKAMVSNIQNNLIAIKEYNDKLIKYMEENHVKEIIYY